MKTAIFIVLFAIVLNVGIVSAEDPEKTEQVVVNGIGIDADKARQNAIRNAVEQIIGTYVASDTMVQNSQLIKDEILTYSSGYVKESKIIATEKNDDGLISVKLEAVVVATKLKRKIQTLNIATKKVDGESLFGESFSKVIEQKSASELLGCALSKYPQAAYIIEVGKPEVKSTDANNNIAKITVPLTIRWDNDFINELKDVVMKVATNEQKMKDMEWLNNRWAERRGANSKNKTLCFSQKGIIKSGLAESCYIIPYQLFKDAVDRGNLREDANLLHLPVSGSDMSLLLTFRNKENNILSTAIFMFDAKMKDSVNKQGIQGNTALIQAILSGEGFAPPNTLWRDLYGSHILLLTDGTLKMSADVNIDISLLSNISTIDVQLNPFR